MEGLFIGHVIMGRNVGGIVPGSETRTEAGIDRFTGHDSWG